MKFVLAQNMFAAALVCGLTFTSAMAQQLPTTGSVDSRLGKLEIDNGYPTEATVKKLYDDIDFQRACQAYLWGLPLIAMVQWQGEQRDKFGAGNLDYVDYLTFRDKLGLLTANATTPYVMAFPNMKDTGPLVVEVPAGAMAGGIVDFWQRPLTDTGQTGPDKGAGGKYLVLGPNDPDMKPEGYYVVRSPTINIWSDTAHWMRTRQRPGRRLPACASIPTANATTRRRLVMCRPTAASGAESSLVGSRTGRPWPGSSIRSPCSSATASCSACCSRSGSRKAGHSARRSARSRF